MSSSHVCLVLLVSVACFHHGVEAKVSAGLVSEPKQQWLYIDKFCFDTSGGEVQVSITPAEGADPDMQILFYHDVGDIWDELYKSGNSCEYKRDQAAQADTISKPYEHNYLVSGVRERWWYVVFANCNGDSIDIEDYTIEFTNTGGTYTRHFSVDEEGIFEALIAFFLILVVITALMTYSYISLRSAKDGSESVMRIMLIVVSIQLISYLFKIIHRQSYSSNGIGLVDLQEFTIFLDFIPQIMIICTFVTIAKGWMVHDRTLRDARPLLEIMFLYLFSCVAVMWWAYASVDPAVNAWIYQSPPGVVLVLFRVIVTLWFVKTLVYETRNHESNKSSEMKQFYTVFAIFGTLYFLSLPVVVLIAESADDWNRAKAVNISEMFFTCLSYFCFWVLFGRNSSYMATVGTTSGSDGTGREMGDEMATFRSDE